ncbi:glycoside hydrolase [Nocardioides sp. CF8]|uniref:hypothetical protein n=1 Tax=Nocardioides sp. CF8 TaxID=110319 RepID=UPI00032FEFA4|nr:hypothetical protein [Nocardioides sp. CF8]EON24461.1 glycoside hydrolase [Nocardioides sp. CF8]
MRGNIALVSLLAAGLLVSAGPATGQERGNPVTGLPEEVHGGVILDLADGDRFKATVSRDLGTVWGSRYDAATRSWGKRVAVLRKKNLFCGDVDGRAAGNAVALIAVCDKGSYAEDQAPTHSQALHSPDTVSWSQFTLPGEAHDEPGISPSGAHAIWPLHDGWVTRSAAGFRIVERDLPGQEYSITGTISDTGDVSVLYGGAHDDDGRCAGVVRVLNVSASGATSRQDLTVDDACADLDLANVDATTVLFGAPDFPETVVGITRPDTASPWAVTAIAPAHAPGLVRHRGRGTAPTLFATSPGLPMLAVGSADKHAFTAQSYDPVAQRWSAPVGIARTADRCTWGDNFHGEPLGVFALRLRCGGQDRVLVSPDARTWHNVGLRASPLGVSPDGSYVAASNRKRTLVFSRERGLVRLPLPTRARCDVVQPVAPDAAIRLTTTNARGWPARLDVSTPDGWQQTRTRFPRLRVGTDRCRQVVPELYESPVMYSFYGSTRAVALTVSAAGDGWQVRRTIY